MAHTDASAGRDGTPGAESQLLQRTRAFALAVVHLVERLPRGPAADVMGRQLLRSATSVGANYRAACRARSRREFAAKMGVVEEELDESAYWLDLLSEGAVVAPELTSGLLRETDELVAMTVASIRTARRGERCDDR